MIALKKYTPNDFVALNSYRLEKHQAQFTADIDYCINKRKDFDDSDRTIVVISFDATPAGFFVLDTGEDKWVLTDNPNTVMLRSLSVNPLHQGKGIGKQAMELVPNFLHEHLSEIHEIALSVNCKNTAAYYMYLRAGYTDTGRKINGPIGQQYVLSRSV